MKKEVNAAGLSFCSGKQSSLLLQAQDSDNTHTRSCVLLE